MSFLPELVGQESVREFLRGVCSTGRVPPGFLFHGAAGRGKATCARALAQRVFCRDGTSCGHCAPCQRMLSGNAADFEWVEAVEGKTTISIDRIRALQAWFARAPFEADRRVAVIDNAHQLTIEGQNSLLKLLEEPPGRGFFILVTPDPARLLETVVSRLQRVHFGPLSDEQMLEVIQRQAPESTAKAREFLPFARGSVGRLLELLADDGGAQMAQAARGLLDRRTGPFSFAERVLGGRGKGRDLRQDCHDIFATSLDLVARELESRLKGGESPLPDLDSKMAQVDFERLLELLIDADRRVRAQSTPRLVLEATKIRIHRVLARSAKRA